MKGLLSRHQWTELWFVELLVPIYEESMCNDAWKIGIVFESLPMHIPKVQLIKYNFESKTSTTVSVTNPNEYYNNCWILDSWACDNDFFKIEEESYIY